LTTSRGGVSVSIDAIYEAALKPVLWPSALETLSETLGIAGVDILSTSTSPIPICNSPSLDAAADAYVTGGWFAENIRLQRGLAVGRRPWLYGRSRLFTDRNVFSDDDYSKCGIQRGFFEKHKLEAFAGAAILENSTAPIVIGFERRKDQASFNDDELALIDDLCQHVAKAARIVATLGLSNAEAIAGAFETLDAPAAVLDPYGCVLRWNEAFDGRLDGALMIEGRRLRHRRSDVDQAIEGMIRATLVRDDRRPAPPVVIPASRSRAVLTALPLRGVAPAVFGGAAALVLLRDARAPLIPRDGALLRACYGLTAAEATLALCLSDGAALAEAAVAQHVAITTARNQLASIFRKMEISRQSQLVAAVGRLYALNARR
jgi:DNA-binding CsgD family transcriptional regulator